MSAIRGRRLLIAAGAIAVALAATVLVVGDDERYRVAAVFDTAKGMVPGQVVKIAGARVGEVTEVELEPVRGGGFKARMSLSIESRFGPFHSDAGCRILPEGLISENYVECDPGKAGEALAAGPAGTPTIALRRTRVPASLQDVLDTFPLSTTQRISVLINQLGLATAGAGEDLNRLIDRANPALAEMRRALAQLSSQREEISDAIGETDRILAALAERDDGVRRFVDEAASTLTTTGSRDAELGEAVARLPGLLREFDRTVAPARDLARFGAPLLASVREAAPGLTALNRSIPAFSRIAVPALTEISGVASEGRRALGPAAPFAGNLKRLSKGARPAARRLERLLTSTRDTGGIEGFLDVWRSIATATSAYDENSHAAGVFVQTVPWCIAANQLNVAEQVPPGCSHAYTSPEFGRVPVTQSPGVAERAELEARLDRRRLKKLLEYMLG